ncbi:MAG: transcriptional regulator, partial [Sphingomicrobium sp.]
ASRPADGGVGAISVLLVLLAVTLFVAVVGAAGVSLGIAAAHLARPGSWRWSTAAGAGGGLVVGAFGNLLGLDAFTLLVGHSPNGITGAAEGALLGAAIGLGTWFCTGSRTLLENGVRGAIAGGVAGTLIGLAGGRLMLGSLTLLARAVPGSRLDLDQIGHLFGESGPGPVTLVVTGGLEAALFAGCVVAAIGFASRAK